ncbi:MAG: pyridoxal phosphate-dependent aminotransferase [Syntrophales bacterium]|jgi:aspartate aminotransferase|nr:pyridoxal phosphate-dependent aminotransferase [Syntrophales bacterium]
MTVAKKIQGFMTAGSFIRKMFEEGARLKQKYGEENVFDFSLGNPNLEAPAAFKKRLRDIASSEGLGMHMYMQNAGYPETRAAVAKELNAAQGVSLSAEEIIMTCGAGGALNVILKTILDPGEEVISPAPFFMEYRFYVDNAGGALRIVPTRDDFSLDLDAIREAINEKTRAVLLNSPNNPTGKIYDESSIRALAEILRQSRAKYNQEIFLISDEPYREIVYDGNRASSILAAYNSSFIATSYSKSLSVPGERIGYIAVNPAIDDLKEVIGGLVLCNRILGFVNAPALMQRIIAGLEGVKIDVESYRRKRDLLCDGLSAAGYALRKPEGTFYLFLKTPIADDVRFADLLREKRILVVPGSGFYGPGHIRIAYCVEDSTITGAMEGFREALAEIR